MFPTIRNEFKHGWVSLQQKTHIAKIQLSNSHHHMPTDRRIVTHAVVDMVAFGYANKPCPKQQSRFYW